MFRRRVDRDVDQFAAVAYQCGDSVPGFGVRRQIPLVKLIGHAQLSG
jgi:hypothetical protein